MEFAAVPRALLTFPTQSTLVERHMDVFRESLKSRVHAKGVMQQHTTLRRVLSGFSLKGKCFLEGFLEGACKGPQ